VPIGWRVGLHLHTECVVVENRGFDEV